jgi:hypothetical protein
MHCKQPAGIDAEAGAHAEPGNISKVKLQSANSQTGTRNELSKLLQKLPISSAGDQF